MADERRRELEREHVEQGVARWGETERADLGRQARAKSLETLRVESTVRRMEAAGRSEDQIRGAIALQADGLVAEEDMGGLVGGA